MDRYTLIPSLVLGFIFVVIHLVNCIKNKKKPELATIITIILSSSGIIGGAILALACFNDEISKHISEMKLYMMIAAIAVIYLGVMEAYKAITLPAKDNSNA